MSREVGFWILVGGGSLILFVVAVLDTLGRGKFASKGDRRGIKA